MNTVYVRLEVEYPPGNRFMCPSQFIWIVKRVRREAVWVVRMDADSQGEIAARLDESYTKLVLT